MSDRNQQAWASRLAGRGRLASNEALLRSGPEGPAAADLVITREGRLPQFRYTIGRLDKHPQLSFESREKALKMARIYARRQKVHIWEKAAGTFTSIAPLTGHARPAPRA